MKERAYKLKQFFIHIPLHANKSHKIRTFVGFVGTVTENTGKQTVSVNKRYL